MNRWLKFVFIFSITLNIFFIAEITADAVSSALNLNDDPEYLERSSGVWWLSASGEYDLLHYAMRENPDVIKKLYQIREYRYKLSDTFSRESFNRTESELLLAKMREELFATQKDIHIIFLNYMETLSMEERHEVVPFLIKGRQHHYTNDSDKDLAVSKLQRRIQKNKNKYFDHDDN